MLNMFLVVLRRKEDSIRLNNSNARELIDAVAGDFNELSDGPLCAFMENKGYVDCAKLTGNADVSTCIAGGRGDYIWINRRLTRNPLEHHVPEKDSCACGHAGKQFLGDHLPLWIKVK